MPGVLYLQTRRRRYFFRRRYPRWLALLIGPGEIVRALPSCAYVDAIDLVRRFTIISDKVLQMAMKVSDLTKEDFENLAKEQFSNFQQYYEDAQMSETSDDPEEWVKKSRETIRNKEWLAVALKPAKKVLEARGYKLDVEDTALREFCLMLIRGLTEASRIATSRQQGDYTARPLDPLFEDAEKAFQGPSKTFSISLSTACEKFREEKIADDSWQNSSIRDNKNCHDLILEWFGDRPINKIARTEVAEFLEMLRKLPSTRGRSNEMREKTLKQYVALTDADPDLKTLSSTTIGKHMRNFGALLDWAIRKGHVLENPVRGVYKPTNKRRAKKNDRDAFTTEQLIHWFSSPVYRGCKSVGRRHIVGAIIIKDSWYWLPLLWLFHPVRPEEMAQLLTSDCKEEDQITYFDIDGGASASEVRETGKKIKTVAARRKIPIHSFLLELGFLNYVKKQRRLGHDRIFSELKPYGGDKSYGGYICKQFRNIIRKSGMDSVSAYSFRHNAITSLAAGCSNETMRKYLQAHKLAGEDDRYVKGFPIHELKVAIDSIAHEGIDSNLFL